MALSRAQKVVLALFVSFLVLTVGGLGLTVYFVTRAPTPAKDSVLLLRVRGELPDIGPPDLAEAIFGGESQPGFLDLLAQIRKAKHDGRIRAILLQLEGFGAGWAKAEELRSALLEFRKSGKPVYAHAEGADTLDYYVATAADHVSLVPTGNLFIQGLASEQMFLKGTLDKVGVAVDVYKIGAYKNAPDSLTRTSMSEAHREAVTALVDDLHLRFVSTVAEARRLTPADVRNLIDGAPYGAAEAKAANLIDLVAYREDLEAALKERLGQTDEDEPLRVVRLGEYRQISPESVGLHRRGKVAIIVAGGGIDSGESNDGAFGDESTGSDTLTKAIAEARDDDDIDAIVLRVNSPGGSAVASDVIWGALEAAKKQKPVVVSMSDYAASGGYYIAAGAHRIVAEPSTLTGSIGVFSGKPVLKGFYDWAGIEVEYVTRGKNAGMFRSDTPFSVSERTRFETLLKDFYYKDFLPKVAAGRKKDVAEIDKVAQGRVWTGAQALEHGLVDELGGLEQAILAAKTLAKLPEDFDVERELYPPTKSLLDELFSRDEDAQGLLAASKAGLPAELARALRQYQILLRAKPGEVLALVPYSLQIR